MNFQEAKTILAANGFDVDVTITKTGDLMQTVYGPSLDLEPRMRQRRELLSQALVMVNDTRVRSKLIELGWVPPEEAAALRRQQTALTTDEIWSLPPMMGWPADYHWRLESLVRAVEAAHGIRSKP